ncbi:murein hydrolase activator EnvC family protein [Kurthia sibirica]|uniref:Peptidase M23 n=1 Tax=Kurthia sibirica TaxID=202750 RepID=A0A2U3AMQ8_9BACL|nr:M23 family metallopeptidase [Kurthia sibirica]PWI25824.1 peptidase M23 [Kurthia sibirica]GEK33642.1 peptidase [Kurthia sibirica]
MAKLTKLTAVALTATLLIPTVSASAESVKDLQSKQVKLNDKKTKINKNIAAQNKKIAANEKALNKQAMQVTKLNKKIDIADDKIQITQDKIEATRHEIAELKKSIAALQKKIDERNEIIKNRARAMQEGDGKISYIDVFLGSSSFSDFIDRASAVNTIVEADEAIINEQKADKEKVEQQKAQVNDKLDGQKTRKTELVALKNSLNAQKQTKKTLIKKMELKQVKLSKQRKKLKEDYNEVLVVSSRVQKKIANEQAKAIAKAKRIAEEKAARAAAKAARAAASSAANASSVSSVASSGSLNSASASTPVKATSGTWIKPAAGRFTSGFAGRDIGAGAEYHYGIDIANSVGTPIVASADGVVFKTGPLSTYGNVVMITHNIKGKTYTSLYAHMSRVGSSAGQSVKQGQVIGYMGSTGRSTGPHVHFEIHTGSWVNQATGAVNPMQFLSQ